MERVRVRQFPRGWSFVQGIKTLPILVGVPISAWLNGGTSNPKAGFLFSLACLVTGGSGLFLMRCFKTSQVSRGYSFASSSR